MFNDKDEIIWPGEIKPNSWAEFLEEIEITDIEDIKAAEIEIAVDTKYNLFINEKLAVFTGGLYRESCNNAGYYDSVDIKEYITNGKNEIRIIVWHYGNGGRNNVRISLAGLAYNVKIDGKNIKKSGESTQSRSLENYREATEPKPSYLYGGDNITFDARVHLQPYHDSKIVGYIGNSIWGRPVKNDLPKFRFSEIKEYESVSKIGDKYICKLPHACHCSPFFNIVSKENVKIDIRTDRYCVNGGPGDEINLYNSQRVEYIAKNGRQEFLALNWYLGEYIIYEFFGSAEVISLGFIESGYDCEILDNYKHSDPEINRLLDKCKRTLYVCMRENFMDCPDRERGQYAGDVSAQSKQVVYALGKSALKLLHKTIKDFINLRKGDVLVGNVPGENFSELPSQSLNAISEIGMIREYYGFTKDGGIIDLCFSPMKEYLSLWEFEDMLLPREGGWYWFDHLNNVDKTVLENAWYYSALKNLIYFAEQSGRDVPGFAAERKEKIENYFDKEFLKENGYRSGEIIDDRANALAVLSGLCKPENYNNVRNVLTNVYESTPYMEYYVLKALCEMGYREDAKRRMLKRYKPLIENDNTTLWEDFSILGTKNHAWSGGPLSILYQYFSDENML